MTANTIESKSEAFQKFDSERYTFHFLSYFLIILCKGSATMKISSNFQDWQVLQPTLIYSVSRHPALCHSNIARNYNSTCEHNGVSFRYGACITENIIVVAIVAAIGIYLG